MADDVTITVHVRDLTGPGFQSVHHNLNQLQRQANQMGGSLRIVGGQLGDLSNAANGASQSLGKSGGGLTGQLIGVGAVLGASVLPAIGAASPMLFGFAAAGGAAALAAKDLKEQAKKLKPEFQDLQKTASKAIMPAVKRSMDDWRGAMKGLQPVVKEGGKAFGDFVEKAAAFADSPAFKSSLLKNVEMGSGFLDGFSTSLLDFTQAYLDFGTKSQPSLDAFQNLLGGLLDTGLPGMFKELEQGIDGSADVINGLASLLNDSLLPSLGKISGSFADAFGPLIGEMLINVGTEINILADVFQGLMRVAEPFADVFADGLRALTDVMQIGADAAGSFAKNVGGALLESLLALTGVDVSNLSGFTGFSDWVKANEPQIRAAFYNMADSITTMVSTGIEALPTLYAAFRTTAEGILTGIDGIVSGLALAFGDLPVIGERFKEWNSNFDEFATSARGDLDKVGNGIDTLANDAVPRLNRAKLSMNVDEAAGNVAYLKRQLEDPTLTKERRARLTADKRAAEEALAKARAELAAFDRKQARAKVGADAGSFFDVLGAVKAVKIPRKTGSVGANASGFWGTVNAIRGRVIGTSYINVVQRAVNNVKSMMPFGGRASGGPVRGYADGGQLQHFPNGGLVEGPGGPRSDSILATFPSGAAAAVSDTEYVVQSSAVKKYGLPLLNALNEGTLKIAGLARGGVTKAEADARRSAMGDLTISRFGQFAGYSRSEFGSAFAKPDSLSGLVNSLNQWRSIIQKSTHGSTERTLLKNLDMWGKGLIRWEKQLNSVSKSLETAKSKLNDLKSAASQLASSVKSGIVSGANITKAASSEDSRVTVNTVLSQMTGSRDQANAFSSSLAQLKKKGLRGDLIQQIGEAGIEGGGLETAQALLGASPAQLRQINSLQSQITSAASSAGKTTADAVYAAQIKAQDALVKKLGAQQDRLVKAMDKLAKGMEKLVERAFGKKAAGGIVGAAASGGIRGGLTWVGEHEPELLQLPVGSRVWSGPDSRRKAAEAAPWASMLTAPRHRAATGAPGAVGPAGPVRPIVLHVSLGGREFGQIWVDVGRREVQTRGGLAATLGGN
jgi:hypothetical protein